jgi:hypothetical protein
MVEMEEQTLFKEQPEYQYLADIISFTSPEEAETASEYLIEEFKHATEHEKKMRVYRATIYSSNRAIASSKRSNLSEEERNQLKKIGEIYKKTYKKMKEELNKKVN